MEPTLNAAPQSHPRGKSTLMPRIGRALAQRFSLLSDKADDAEIERRIRDGVELSGATPWILVFAILVASVGLNVNSTAVIIGAMLISPLMAPIMGAGLGAAVYDFVLVKRVLLNLGIATLISVLVSALYFALTPLQDAQSELLARTTPTIWDVLIALFGGLAGVIGMTRQEKSNVIPGVAIATALMPPACTAGFGLATGQWDFFGGALYLYTINCVFIGLATVIGIRILRLKRHGFADPKVERRVKLSLLAIALGTAIPSAYLAANLVKDELLKSNARKFVAQEFRLKETQVASSNIDPATRTIELALIGMPLKHASLQAIEGRLAQAQLKDTKIVIHQSGDNSGPRPQGKARQAPPFHMDLISKSHNIPCCKKTSTCPRPAEMPQVGGMAVELWFSGLVGLGLGRSGLGRGGHRRLGGCGISRLGGCEERRPELQHMSRLLLGLAG